MIIADAITLSYGKGNVIENASFHILPGQAVVLSGDNGSGKSTLLSAMGGVLKPKSGSLTVNGKLSYIPQGIGLIEELRFCDNLRFFASLSGCQVPKELPFGAQKLLKKRVRDMSGGMKKLCSIICGTLSRPQILLLDEPCASLDGEHRRMLLDYLLELKQQGVTLVYVGHDPEEYRAFADRVLLVEQTVTDMPAGEYLEKLGGRP